MEKVLRGAIKALLLLYEINETNTICAPWFEKTFVIIINVCSAWYIFQGSLPRIILEYEGQRKRTKVGFN